MSDANDQEESSSKHAIVVEEHVVQISQCFSVLPRPAFRLSQAIRWITEGARHFTSHGVAWKARTRHFHGWQAQHSCKAIAPFANFIYLNHQQPEPMNSPGVTHPHHSTTQSDTTHTKNVLPLPRQVRLRLPQIGNGRPVRSGRKACLQLSSSHAKNVSHNVWPAGGEH